MLFVLPILQGINSDAPCSNVCQYSVRAVLAQLVERMAFNRVAVGSIPTGGICPRGAMDNARDF